MSKKTKLYGLGLSTLLLMGSMTPSAWAETIELAVPISEQPIQITTKEVVIETAEFNMKMKIPVIKGVKDEKYQAQLNDIITTQAMKDKEIIEQQGKEMADDARKNGWEVRPSELVVDYEVKGNKDVMSIIIQSYIYTGGANGINRTDYHNFINEKDARNLQLNELFKDGVDYQAIINEKIKQQIEQRMSKGEMFFEGDMGFEGIRDNQDFYLTENGLVIAFSQYEIAPRVTGTPEFSISYSELETVLVSRFSDSHTMVPLRSTAEQLGYEITWNEETKSIELKKGNQWTQIQIGEDRYFFAKMAPFSLGQAPEIKDERTYVPSSFFSDVLKVTVKDE